ncbi:MAG: DNA-directed RNA polymerase subunit K [Candidatus Diapherotrites archaeon]|nr:DNA-directed RNA polymerase subunit K [Candidatus Diapherotrites archaeon]
MERLTRFEYTRLVSARALQLSLGASPLVKHEKGLTVYEIAKKELDDKVIPLAVIRTYPTGTIQRVEVV